MGRRIARRLDAEQQHQSWRREREREHETRERTMPRRIRTTEPPPSPSPVCSFAPSAPPLAVSRSICAARSAGWSGEGAAGAPRSTLLPRTADASPSSSSRWRTVGGIDRRSLSMAALFVDGSERAETVGCAGRTSVAQSGVVGANNGLSSACISIRPHIRSAQPATSPAAMRPARWRAKGPKARGLEPVQPHGCPQTAPHFDRPSVGPSAPRVNIDDIHAEQTDRPPDKRNTQPMLTSGDTHSPGWIPAIGPRRPRRSCRRVSRESSTGTRTEQTLVHIRHPHQHHHHHQRPHQPSRRTLRNPRHPRQRRSIRAKTRTFLDWSLLSLVLSPLSCSLNRDG